MGKKDEYIEAMRVYHQEGNRVLELFKADSLAEVGLASYPKAEKVWKKAWDDGHSQLQDVLLELEDLAELIL